MDSKEWFRLFVSAFPAIWVIITILLMFIFNRINKIIYSRNHDDETLRRRFAEEQIKRKNLEDKYRVKCKECNRLRETIDEITGVAQAIKEIANGR